MYEDEEEMKTLNVVLGIITRDDKIAPALNPIDTLNTRLMLGRENMCGMFKPSAACTPVLLYSGILHISHVILYIRWKHYI